MIPVAPPTPEVKAVLENAVEKLGRAGAKMKQGWPEGLKPAELLANYKFMLEAFFYSTAPPEEQERERKSFSRLDSGKELRRAQLICRLAAAKLSPAGIPRAVAGLLQAGGCLSSRLSLLPRHSRTITANRKNSA